MAAALEDAVFVCAMSTVPSFAHRVNALAALRRLPVGSFSESELEVWTSSLVDDVGVFRRAVDQLEAAVMDLVKNSPVRHFDATRRLAAATASTRPHPFVEERPAAAKRLAAAAAAGDCVAIAREYAAGAAAGDHNCEAFGAAIGAACAGKHYNALDLLLALPKSEDLGGTVAHAVADALRGAGERRDSAHKEALLALAEKHDAGFLPELYYAQGAAQAGHLDIVQEFLAGREDHWPEPGTACLGYDYYIEKTLDYATSEDQFDLVRAVLARAREVCGAEHAAEFKHCVEYQFNNAAYCDHIEMLDVLREFGATNLNEALESAAGRGHAEMAIHLLNMGASNRDEAIAEAKKRGHGRLARRLAAVIAA